MLPSSTVKMTRAIPEPKDERTSHRSGASFLVRGIPTGQPNCSVFTSSPMTRLSSFRKLFSHSLRLPSRVQTEEDNGNRPIRWHGTKCINIGTQCKARGRRLTLKISGPATGADLVLQTVPGLLHLVVRGTTPQSAFKQKYGER